jgi:serine/threonine protein kinase
MAERTDQVGQRFGDYWLRRRLGGGGFGDVYLGEHVQTKSLAAVKVLHIRLTRSEDLRAFINEVRTFRLQHPHIVRVLDVGIASDETPFLVMEYAPNGTLRDRHPKGTRLLLSTVLTYVVPLASALQYAHDLHLVHRDVKPENMLLGAGEVLWLSDFGIATVAHSTGSLTTEGMGGTLPYMAPEQIQGRPRPQSDQYALAIVVYEWLTGTWPFRGTPIEIAMQHQMTPPPPLRTQVPTLPPEVEQVVLTALAKDPKERFGTIQAFATDLMQAAQAPLEQSTSPETSRQAISTTEHLQSRPTVKATESEWQQAGASPLTGPHTTGAVPAPSTANVVSENPPGSFPAPSESGTSSATPSPPLPDTLSHPPTEPSHPRGIADMPMQAAAITPPAPAPRQTKRRPSPAVTVVLILLALTLLGGVSFAIYHGVTTSPWTTQTSGTSSTLLGVAWSGSQFVAVGTGGTILTSP